MNEINGAILSPLAGYTDMAFRELASSLNAFMTVTEMVSAKALYFEDKKTKSLMEISPKEKNVAIQIFGNEPDIMGEVVKKYLNNSPYSMIDINMGCPAPKIVKNGQGSALIKNRDLAYEVMKNVVRNSTKPVSIKIRKSIDGIDSMEIVRLANKAGVSMITVHGRSREEYYSGLSDWNYIKEVVINSKVPVIGNGDIKNYEDFLEKKNYSKVSGISIGRGAIGNPFIFDEIYKKSMGFDYRYPTNIDRINMAIKHLDLIVKYKGQRLGVLEMRKQFVGYFKSMKGSKDLRDKINKISDDEEIKRLLKEYRELVNS